MYSIPEFCGGVSGLIVPVQNLDYAHSHPVEASNDYSKYHECFQYDMNELQVTIPNDWKGAAGLNKTTTNSAVNGI